MMRCVTFFRSLFQGIDVFHVEAITHGIDDARISHLPSSQNTIGFQNESCLSQEHDLICGRCHSMTRPFSNLSSLVVTTDRALFWVRNHLPQSIVTSVLHVMGILLACHHAYCVMKGNGSSNYWKVKALKNQTCIIF